MRTKSTTNKVLSLVLVVCFMVSMLPMMLVSANGGVEITSPSYGGFLAYGKEVVIRVEADSAPTISVNGSVLGKAEGVAGVYDYAWTPAAYGEATITAEVGGVTDTLKVFVGNTTVLSDWDMSDTTWGNSDNHYGPKCATADGVASISTGGFTVSEWPDAVVDPVVREGAYIYEMALTIPENEEGTYHEFRHRTSSTSAQRIANFKNGTINLASFNDNDHWDEFYTPGVPFVMTVVFDYTDKTIDIYKDGVLKYSDVVSADNDATFAAIRGFQWYADTALIVDRLTLSKEGETELTIVSPANNEVFLPGDNVVVKVKAQNLPAGETVTVATNGGTVANATQVGDSNIYAATLTLTANDTQILAKAGNVTSDVLSLDVKSQLWSKTYDFNSATKGQVVKEDDFCWGFTVSDVKNIDNEHGTSLYPSPAVLWNTKNLNTAPKNGTFIVEMDFYLEGKTDFALELQAVGGYGARDLYLSKSGVAACLSADSTDSTWNYKPISENEWHTLKLVVDIQSRTKSIYVDGELYHKNFSLNTKAVNQMNSANCGLQRIQLVGWNDIPIDNITFKFGEPAASGLSIKMPQVVEVNKAETIALSSGAAATFTVNGEVIATNATSASWTPSEAGTYEVMAVAADGKFASKTVTAVHMDVVLDTDWETATTGGTIPENEKLYSIAIPTAGVATDNRYGTSVNTGTGYMFFNPKTHAGKSSGYITFETDIYLNDSGKFAIIPRANNDSSGAWAFQVTKDYISGQSTAWTNFQAGPSVGAWHKVKVIFNLNSKTQDMYLDGEIIKENVPMAAAYTSGNATQITRLYIHAGNMYMDNTRLAYDYTPAATAKVANTKFISGRSELDTVAGLNYHDTVAFSTDVTAAAAGDVWVTFIAYKNQGNGAVQVTGKNMQKVTMAAGETKTVSGNFRLGASLTSGDYMKVFVWTDGMEPLCDAIVLD